MEKQDPRSQKNREGSRQQDPHRNPSHPGQQKPPEKENREYENE